MKRFFVVALTLALTMAFIGCDDHEIIWEAPPAPEPVIVQLGDYTKSGNNQAIWYVNGQDNQETDLTIDDFLDAVYLYLELEADPAGGVQLIWQGDGVSASNWNQSQIVANNGTPSASLGVTLSDKVLKIELSKALEKYDDYLKCTTLKLIVAYYSTTIDDLGIKKAYLSDQ